MDSGTASQDAIAVNDFVAELFAEEPDAAPAAKKRKFSPPPLLASSKLVFCPLQQQAWPKLVYRHENEVIDMYVAKKSRKAFSPIISSF